MHAAAAMLLASEHAEPQAIAAHLLNADPAGDPTSVEHLRAAARAALGRGAPSVAVTDLRRALAEPPAGDEFCAVLIELGRAEWMVGDPAAVEHLQAARELIADPAQRARLDYAIAEACFYAGARDRTVEVLARSIRDLGGADPEQMLRLEVMATIALAILDCGWPAEQDAEHRRLARLLASVNESDRSLQLTLGFVDMVSGDRSLAELLPAIEAALDEAVLSCSEPGRLMPLGVGLFALVYADRLERAVGLTEQIVSDAASQGAFRGLGLAHHVRALAELRRGALVEAETSARMVFELTAEREMSFAASLCLSCLGEALLERGAVDEAAELLLGMSLTSTPPVVRDFMRPALARLHSTRGDREAAIAELLAMGEEAAPNGMRNPSCIPWRAELALLLAEENPSRARELAESQLHDAERIGLPRSIGTALRARAATERGAVREMTLRESVAALEGSPARLELTRALIDLGAELRRAGKRAQAREPLRRALELASRCGAEPLAAIAAEELSAADGRPRRPWLTGVDALTPSELRVARQAADGHSNREIAQALFVTTKTIEMHLSNVYRKLNIDSRERLRGVLNAG
jgi:DNA-binding CsgD family transcriptional regulator